VGSQVDLSRKLDVGVSALANADHALQNELAGVRKALADASEDVVKKQDMAELTEKAVDRVVNSCLSTVTAKLDALESGALGPVMDSLDAIKAQLHEQAKVAGRNQESLKAVLSGLGNVLGAVDEKLGNVVVGVNQLTERLDLGSAGLLNEVKQGNRDVKAACDRLEAVAGELQRRAGAEGASPSDRLAALEAGQQPVLDALRRLQETSSSQQISDAVRRLEERWVPSQLLCGAGLKTITMIAFRIRRFGEAHTAMARQEGDGKVEAMVATLQVRRLPSTRFRTDLVTPEGPDRSRMVLSVPMAQTSLADMTAQLSALRQHSQAMHVTLAQVHEQSLSQASHVTRLTGPWVLQVTPGDGSPGHRRRRCWT
jgi:hypothetical protein